jgi:hypothetical protein
MTIPALKAQEFLQPGSTIELRQSTRDLANSALPYLEAWRLCERGQVEGVVKGSKLRYLKLLSEEDFARVLAQRESDKRPEEISSGGCTLPSTLRMGVFREHLPEAIVQQNVFGQRAVIAEGELVSWTYSFHLNG